ncbi:hypothetical protein ABI59_16355 [Acidobacteria bacterium Mor1]|nr:hypothetical protein ABI59_16355 [Acidobacteria bacterium Mor1]
MHLRFALLLLALAVSLPAVAGKDLIDRLPADPHLAGAYSTDLIRLAETWAAWFDDPDGAPFQFIDNQLGVSFREDVLTALGPDLAFSFELPSAEAMDQALEAGFTRNAETLEGLLLVVEYRDRERALAAVKALTGWAGGWMTRTDDTRFVIHFGVEAEETLPILIGRVGKRYISIAGAEETALQALKGFRSRDSLKAGKDFSFVSSRIDPSPETMTYYNLPKIRTWLQAREADALAQQAMPDILSDEWMGFGVIYASSRVEGGTRSNAFGPDPMVSRLSPVAGGSGTAMWFALLLASSLAPEERERPGEKEGAQTVLDLRQIASAVEAYAVMQPKYPSTDGWVPLEEFAAANAGRFAADVPMRDEWGEPYQLKFGEHGYCVISLGADREREQDWDGTEEIRTVGDGADVVLCNHVYIQAPVRFSPFSGG